MNVSSLNKTVQMLSRLLDYKTATEPFAPAMAQKPVFTPSPMEQPFERATPESQGVSSVQMAEFVRHLQEDTSLHMHNLMILRHGKVIVETSFGQQDLSVWKATFSACKSVTSLAVGLLVDDGLLHLDDKVLDFFDKKVPALSWLKLKDLTVRHLLTMTSGVLFNEAEATCETDWVRCFFNSMTDSEPGKKFNYNSLNTYMLSVLIRKITGKTLSTFLTERLFGPLGIHNFFWETCPKGIEKGGWGLYIRPEDMAKLGQLVLQKGIWNGDRLISEAWITAATAPHMRTPESFGDFSYGYQCWAGEDQNSFLFNGLLGQNVLGLWDSDILIVTNAGNAEMFQSSRYFDWVRRYFYHAFGGALPEDSAGQAVLAGVIAGLPLVGKRPEPTFFQRLLHREPDFVPPALCAMVAGRTYRVRDDKAYTLGFLPLVWQAVQNNYSRGMTGIEFSLDEGTFMVTYHEIDQHHRFAVGFDRPVVSSVVFHNEPFRISAFGSCTTDEDGRPVLKIDIDFQELPCSRSLRLYFEDGAVELRQGENPSGSFIIELINGMQEDLKDKALIGMAFSKMDSEYLQYRVHRVFSPTVRLYL